MSILVDITTLESKKNQFDLLLSSGNLDINDRYKLEILKEEMLNILSNIFSVYSTNVISNSFYLQVNELEKQICDLIIKENEELNVISKEKEKIVDISKKVITYVSSSYILNNDIHIGINIDKRLLDIKNYILDLNINDKRICALSFIESKLTKYTTGLKRLIEIVSEIKQKSSLTFEKRQEIFDILKEISLSQQVDKSHSKMFNEDSLTCDINTIDYIKWYENLFLENCNAIGLNLASYYLEICNYLADSDISVKSILSYVDEYITKKYKAQIKAFNTELTNLTNKTNYELKHQLTHCYSYSEDFNFDNLLVKIESDSSLLNLFDDSNTTDIVKKLHYRSKLSVKNNIILYNVLDELNELINKNFDYNDYLEIYIANSKYKNRQIAGFRAYYMELLESSRKELSKKYSDRIEKTLESINVDKFSIDDIMTKYNNKNAEIEELNQALSYINKNFRDFNEPNIKLYLKSVEDRYSVKNLYEKISSRNSNFIYKLKTKRIIKKELPYIESFINETELLNKLKNTLIDNVLVNRTLVDKLKNSMIQ